VFLLVIESINKYISSSKDDRTGLQLARRLIPSRYCIQRIMSKYFSIYYFIRYQREFQILFHVVGKFIIESYVEGALGNFGYLVNDFLKNLDPEIAFQVNSNQKLMRIRWHY